MSIQQFPLIKPHQFVLVRDDLYTGIIKDANMENAINESQEVYTVYESLSDAIKAGESIIKEYDFIECTIFDSDREVLKHLQPL